MASDLRDQSAILQGVPHTAQVVIEFAVKFRADKLFVMTFLVHFCKLHLKQLPYIHPE